MYAMSDPTNSIILRNENYFLNVSHKNILLFLLFFLPHTYVHCMFQFVSVFKNLCTTSPK